jgi:hypothetical protein
MFTFLSITFLHCCIPKAFEGFFFAKNDNGVGDGWGEFGAGESDAEIHKTGGGYTGFLF